jgi:manganese/zinc/iron transport system permease protein
MNTLISLINDYTFQTVALGSALLGIISGALGCFSLLRKQCLISDCISNAALPGIVTAFLIIGSKNTEILLIGALISGLIASALITIIVRYTPIKFDSALALIMSVFFGLGIVLLSFAQKNPVAQQAGLKNFIFGQASALLQHDIYIMLLCGSILLMLVIVFWKELKLFTFDHDFAQILGFSPRILRLLLSSMVVIAIIIGLQTVGIILMSALLITPAAAARQWTNTLWIMISLSALFGALSGIAGTIISSLIPNLPTGPAIVICASAIFIASILFAPGRGICYHIYQRTKERSLCEGNSTDVTSR